MADLNLPTPNKDPGDGAPADDMNLVIEAINTLNSAVENIDAGPQGPQGEPGTPGANGEAATVSVAATVTTTPGGDAQVVEGGTAQNRTLTFYIPRGEQGPQGEQGLQGAQGPAGDPGVPAAISVGTVTTGAPESQASVTNSGSTSNVVLDFSIPRGPQGEAVNLGDNPASDLGVSSAGTSTAASRQDHVHKIPTASDVGADASGSASAAQSAAQSYADSLASNYDPAGSASAAQSAAISYADGLASNYDSAGSAAAVASDLTDHENDSTNVHGIADTSALATTQYVDEVAQGLIARPSVLGASGSNIDATYANGTAGVGATLTANSNGEFPSSFGGASGWALGSGVLVKDQTNKAENGRYVITDLGSVSTPYVLTRCGLCDEADEIPGSYIFVQDGTLAATGWVQIVDDPSTFTVGTDDIDVYQFSGAGTYTAGAGLDLSGTEFSVPDDGHDHVISNVDGLQTALDGAVAKSIVDAKGDIIVATASDTVSRLAVGSNGQALIADSNEAAGVKWSAVESLPTQTGNDGKLLITDGTDASWSSTVTSPTAAGSNGVRNITMSTSSPSGGNDGDLWVQYS